MRERGEIIGSGVARLLGELRRQAGLTMDELADRAGVHRTYIGLLEGGKRQPTIAAAARIAAALGTSLADLLREVEDHSAAASIEVVPRPAPRRALSEHFQPAGGDALARLTGLGSEVIAQALESAYHTLDLIDDQLRGKNVPPIAQLVELANLSAMLGNLLAAGIAEASQGRFARNRPHAFPDLLAQTPGTSGIELKTALERNRPKGHLAKAGLYLTFRYVLAEPSGGYVRGKAGRGSVATVWEVRCGALAEDDFALSNTAGDSGKTAVITSAAFGAMALVYHAPEFDPSVRGRR